MQSFVPAKFSPTKFVQKLGEISTCCSLSRCYFSSLNLCFDAFFLWTEKMSKNEIMYLGLQRGHFAWNFLEMAPKADTPFKLLMVKSDVTVSNHLNKILFDKVSFFFFFHIWRDQSTTDKNWVYVECLNSLHFFMPSLGGKWPFL